MKFISETIIEDVIQKYEDIESFQRDLDSLKNLHPVLFQFIDKERLDLLKPEELSLLEFMTLVIFTGSQVGSGQNLMVNGKTLEISEENNWEIWNAHIIQSPKKAFDAFFTDYPQEDLLAFVEDSLQMDDDQFVTGVGVELIAVTAKSIIDTIHQLN